MNKTLITFFTVLFCLTSSVSWSFEYKDLVERDGIYYKKFTDVPFTGKIDGQFNGLIENGKREGSWVVFHQNGHLYFKGDYKNGKEDSSWVSYWDNGQLNYKGNYNNGKREGSYELYYRNGQLNKKMKWKYGFGVKK